MWLLENTLTLGHAGEPLSAYEVAYDAAFPGVRRLSSRLRVVRLSTLLGTSHVMGQMRLFCLAETLGEDGWLKALRLEDHAPWASCRLDILQQVLFAYTDAV